ncbi:MAG: hypothetical protein PVG19_04955, partial [Desulfobacterales bacterium]
RIITQGSVACCHRPIGLSCANGAAPHGGMRPRSGIRLDEAKWQSFEIAGDADIKWMATEDRAEAKFPSTPKRTSIGIT